MIKIQAPRGCLSGHTIPSNHSILYDDSKSVTDIKVTGDIVSGKRNNEVSSRFDFAIGATLWFEETLLFPPVGSSHFDSRRIVARGR